MSSSSESKIYFFFKTQVSLRNRTYLKAFIALLFKKEGKQLESLNYVFCTDKELLKINRQYLKHDFYTDIITFELSPVKTNVLGEIYISVDRVKDNAKQLGEPFHNELHRVIFHGALHLCGYADRTKNEKEQMRLLENYCLKNYFK